MGRTVDIIIKESTMFSWPGVKRMNSLHRSSLSHRPRYTRLRLDELEPRVSPSSLLYSLPFLGAMLDAFATRDERDSGFPIPDSDSAADPYSALRIPQSEFASSPDDFSPVVPSQLRHPRPTFDAYYEAAHPDVDSGYESAQQDDSLLPLLLLAPEEGPDSVD
ncbi:MAG: hypothetical protein FJ279_32070, partial [Planctomycetes bacterium]|nr:hypothetical protein [Planctomycetota bacterium]